LKLLPVMWCMLRLPVDYFSIQLRGTKANEMNNGRVKPKSRLILLKRAW
jgi:hypothetical protein